MRKRKSKLIFILPICITILIGIILTSCGDETVTTIQTNDDRVSLTYTADFYNNFGGRWLSVEGKTFSIKPNKVKNYYYNDDGDWTYKFEMSSMMSITIDGHDIESCGSTVIFADSRLEKCDIEFDTVTTENSEIISENASISQPSDLRIEDWFKIQYWWIHKNLNNDNRGSRLVVVQSQLGNSICMYMGDDVSWDIPENLPKTTKVTIDDKVLYVHRANVSIIDTALIK